MEDDFLVDVRVYVFPIEFGVELGRDGLDGLVGAEEDGEGDLFIVLLCALFGEDVGTHNLGIRVFFVPGTEEDVVLFDGLLDMVSDVVVDS